jgi:hypothetical protein
VGWTAGVRVPQAAGIFFLLATASRLALGPTQPPSKGYGDLLPPEVKRPGCEPDHSSTSNTEVKETWNYTSISPNVFRAWCLIKHRIRLYGVVLSLAQGQLYLLPIMLPEILNEMDI